MRLVSSEVALRVVVALTCADGLTLSELGRAAEAPTSSTKRALEILEDDGFVVRSGHAFRLARSAPAGLLVQLAEELFGAEDVIRIAARAAGQVEFVGRDESRLLVLFGRASDTLVESRLARLFERQAQRLGIELRLNAHDDIRRELDVDPDRRSAYLQLRPLFGDPDQAFPDRRLHGITTGEQLGRPHPLLRRPSARALHRLRRRHGIRSAKVFGSAVRTDFRPDSDVDVAVELDRKPTPSEMIAIEREFEELFGRDVDVIIAANARPRVQAAIENEGVDILP
jgi:predicted nucleotidyltransferase